MNIKALRTQLRTERADFKLERPDLDLKPFLRLGRPRLMGGYD